MITHTLTITSTIDPILIQDHVHESLAGTDSKQVSQVIFDILTQAYKDIVHAPSQFNEEPIPESEKQSPNWRMARTADKDLTKKRIGEQRERIQTFNYILYPTIADVKYSIHYEVFKTLVAKILDKQEAAREAKNEHAYVLAKHNVSEAIRSLIK